MKKMWQINKLSKLHQKVGEFSAGTDSKLDQELVAYDIAGSMAHAKMLNKIGILTSKELKQILGGLKIILKEDEEGLFKIKVKDEDVHTAVENKLIKLIGNTGKKLHTARSRNDQVLVDLKLYIKDKLIEVEENMGELIVSLKAFCKKHGKLPMPGYTHMQKAMPSNLKMWSEGFADTLKDDLILIKAVYKLADQNPLGSGAGFGVSLPVDKKLTTKLLGFNKVQENPITCQHWRGKLELAVIQALTQIMISLSKLAQDLLLYTMVEFDFFTIKKELTTGSSIMPNKKNLDVAELIRARAHTMVGLATMTAGTSVGLVSGFNRDLQEAKGPLMEGLKITSQSLVMSKLLIDNLQPNANKLALAMTEELYATDKVYELVLKGMAFKDAYKKIKEELYEK